MLVDDESVSKIFDIFHHRCNVGCVVFMTDIKEIRSPIKFFSRVTRLSQRFHALVPQLPARRTKHSRDLSSFNHIARPWNNLLAIVSPTVPNVSTFKSNVDRCSFHPSFPITPPDQYRVSAYRGRLYVAGHIPKKKKEENCSYFTIRMWY